MNRSKNIFIVYLSLSIILMSQSCVDLFKKDLSFTKKEYKKLGMPDCAKIWSKEEYAMALSALRNLKLYNPLLMPRKNSRKSGDIFKRLLSEENISFLQDSTLSLADKAFKVQSFSSYQKGLIFLYSVGIKDDKYYNKELIDIYIFGLFVYKNMLELADKISNSDDMMSIELNPGRSFVSQSYLDLIFTITEEQVKADKYSKKDLNRLSKQLLQSLSGNWKWIDQSDREQIKKRMKRIIKNPPSDKIKASYQDALETLS
jgi:hypothetical protein